MIRPKLESLDSTPTDRALVSADVTGERDGRISWGPTAVLNPVGEVVAQLPLEQPGLLVFDIPSRL